MNYLANESNYVGHRNTYKLRVQITLRFGEEFNLFWRQYKSYSKGFVMNTQLNI